MSDATRQHYDLATGKGLQGSPAKTSTPGFKKGGAAKSAKSMPKSRSTGKKGR